MIIFTNPFLGGSSTKNSKTEKSYGVEKSQSKGCKKLINSTFQFILFFPFFFNGKTGKRILPKKMAPTFSLVSIFKDYQKLGASLMGYRYLSINILI